MSLTPADFGATQSATPIVTAPLGDSDGQMPPMGATSVTPPPLPGAGVPMAPVPAAIDPATTTNSDGVTKAAQNAADAKAAAAATALAVAQAKQAHLNELLKDEVFAEHYFELKRQRDTYRLLADPATTGNATPFHRELFDLLGVGFDATITEMEAAGT